MKEMCSIRAPYRCPKCGQDMLFFVTDRNTLVDYKELMANAATSFDVKSNLYKRNIKYIKCICCNEYHIIDWTHGLPEPLTQNTQFDYIMQR